MERKPITIRPVEGFDPYDYVFCQRDEITGNPVISEITGEEKKYLIVKAQKVWFQKVFPDGCIQIVYIPRDDGQHQFHARIYQHRDDALKATEHNPDAGTIATADALRLPSPGEKYKAFESAQTMAISYALENAGFGSEIALQLACQERSKLRSATKVKAAPEEPKPESVSNDDIFNKMHMTATKKADVEAEGENLKDTLESFSDLFGGKLAVDKQEEPKAAQEEPKAAQEEPKAAQEEPEEREPKEEPEPKPEPQGDDEKAKEIKLTKKASKADSKKAALSAGDYVITQDDVIGVPPLESYIGMSLNEIGKEDVQTMLNYVGSKLADGLRNIATEFVEE